MHAILDRHGLVKRRRRQVYKPAGTALSRPHSLNDLWCADYKDEFMLADRVGGPAGLSILDSGENPTSGRAAATSLQFGSCESSYNFFRS